MAARVAARLPAQPAELLPASDASDAVILHLWQATQIVIDLAVAACVAEGLGTPKSYADAFTRLARAGVIPADLADRLVRGPADLRAFLGAAARLVRADDDDAPPSQ